MIVSKSEKKERLHKVEEDEKLVIFWFLLVSLEIKEKLWEPENDKKKKGKKRERFWYFLVEVGRAPTEKLLFLFSLGGLISVAKGSPEYL